MTIGTNQNTLVKFRFHPIPPSRISLGRNTKIFLAVFEVVKLEGINAPTIPADRTIATFVLYRFPADFFAPFFDGGNEVISPVCVLSGIAAHAVFTAGCSTIELPRNL